MADKLRILIAEDHEIVREGFRLLVESQDDMEVVGCAGDGRTAVELARSLMPDIVLMDISMPELNGLLAAAKLKRIAPEIKILILTRHTDTAYFHELMQAGVSGYALKQSEPAELIRGIRTIANGGNYLDPAITAKVFEGYIEKQHTVRGDTSSRSMTEREREVFRYVALGYSNQEIAAKLNISVKTVEAHKASSLKKLNMQSRSDIVKYAIQQGWMEEN